MGQKLPLPHNPKATIAPPPKHPSSTIRLVPEGKDLATLYMECQWQKMTKQNAAHVETLQLCHKWWTLPSGPISEQKS